MLGKGNARTGDTKRKMRAALRDDRPLAQVYALRAWSVKKSGGKWYISPTACFGGKPDWSRSYATLQRATTAIARKLAEEVITRHKRRCEQDGTTE